MASALIFPMAARVYCAHQWSGVHAAAHFGAIRMQFSERLSRLQLRSEKPIQSSSVPAALASLPFTKRHLDGIGAEHVFCTRH